ncbi:MAG: four helix bundle protein [Candidatus Omnitrophica bacterium]|nr:four helix bundle protein [Candidatus Omnitrophota bacterium]
MSGFKSLTVWQKSHELVLEVYKRTRSFPSDERFCMTQQMRRAAISIAANIAEGSKRRSDKDYCHFLNMSEGSLEELKYYLVLSRDLKYLREEFYLKLFSFSEEVGRLLNGFVKRLRTAQ